MPEEDEVNVDINLQPILWMHQGPITNVPNLAIQQYNNYHQSAHSLSKNDYNNGGIYTGNQSLKSQSNPKYNNADIPS